MITVFSDPHVSPGQNLDRFKWLSKRIRDTKPTHVVCLGDFATLDSCSFHEPAGSKTEKTLPSLAQDAKACVTAQLHLFSALGTHLPKFVMVKGNHEHRYNRWAELHPRQASVIDFDELFEFSDFWDTIVEYRNFIEICGITFTHIPHSRGGRAVEGVNKSRRVCVESSGPLVFGHGHDMQVATNGDIRGGPAQRFAISCPAFMPDGNVEKYAIGSQTGWSYGMLEIRPQGKDRIPSFNYLSMRDLKGMYS